MNEVLKTIEKRRSVRGFSNEQISKDDLDKIIKAGFQAPSAMNNQDWHFVVVQNQELINELNNVTKGKLNEEARKRMVDRFNGDENFSVFYNAPTLVLVFRQENSHYSTLNCGFASQNIVLASESLGYGSCYIGMSTMLFENKEYYEKLNVPAGYEIAIVIALGKPNKDMPKTDRDFNKISYFL